MMRKHVVATLAYTFVSFALAAPWHLMIFKDLYDSFGIYSRPEPIIPLGVLSMLVQGAVLSALYARWRRGGSPVSEGIQFGLLTGAFLFSVSTLANAAKMNVHGLPTFMGLQVAFHLLQFTGAGLAIGLVFGRSDSKER